MPTFNDPTFTRDHIKAHWMRCSEWHWQIKTLHGLLDYWPTRRKWRYHDENHIGSWEDLQTFITNEGGAIPW